MCKEADRALIALSASARSAAAADDLCCDAFRRGVFAASLADPRCCMYCWPARRAAQLAARYAWRSAPFGHIRQVPPWQARRWAEADQRVTRPKGAHDDHR